MKIGVIGNGYVGRATSMLACNSEDLLVWDTDESKRNVNNFTDLKVCDFVFVCVPTPMNKDGSCYLGIVEEVVNQLITLGLDNESIVVRSTVPVGTSKNLGVSFMPEFLTEANWEEDFKNNKLRIIGLQDTSYSNQLKFTKLFQSAKDCGKINESFCCFCSTDEAELAKLVRNCFLALKVSFFNEIEDFCSKSNIDYKMVSSLACQDSRIGESHTQVPGPDGQRGYGGTCFPKDMNSLLNQIEKISSSHIVQAAVHRNQNVDRPQKDWEQNKGRSVL
tara:strand:+ start:854 stop:1684 length:831 start_codon:yes stop_codon:yes gene_type:complete